ncbi:MAG: hypothetical protein ACK4IK_07695 [Bacteroidia bacterium]
MKILLTLFSFLTISSFQIFAQTIENEVVLASEKFNIQNIQEIKQLLQTKEGLIYKGFCEEHKVILVLIEGNKFNYKTVIEIVNEVIPSNSILNKEGGFEAAYKVCSDKEKMHLK